MTKLNIIILVPFYLALSYGIYLAIKEGQEDRK